MEVNLVEKTIKLKIKKQKNSTVNAVRGLLVFPKIPSWPKRKFN